jgi:hypothetical protein
LDDTNLLDADGNLPGRDTLDVIDKMKDETQEEGTIRIKLMNSVIKENEDEDEKIKKED